MTRVWYRLFWLTLALVLPGCTKFDVLNATVPPLGYCRTSGLAYGESPRQKLDVYEPSQKLDRAAPVVVFFYGGSWQFGERRNYRFVGQALADHGIVAVLPDYRLYPEVTFPGFVEDGAKAVRWTHDNVARFGGDPSRVFLMGHSAGAHIATLLALDEHYLKDVGRSREIVRGVIGLSGPYDFTPGEESRVVFRMSRGDKADPAIEPIHFAAAAAQGPPLLLIHGGRDSVIGQDNTVKFARAVQDAGGDARAVVYSKLDHAGVCLALASPFHWLAPVFRDVLEFVEQH